MNITPRDPFQLELPLKLSPQNEAFLTGLQRGHNLTTPNYKCKIVPEVQMRELRLFHKSA